MPKLGMGPIRRQQLVEAAIAVIHEQGFANALSKRVVRCRKTIGQKVIGMTEETDADFR